MVYLDNSATTPLCDAAREAMMAAMDCYGNPSSLHAVGQEAHKRMETARAQLAAALGLIFGSVYAEQIFAALAAVIVFAAVMAVAIIALLLYRWCECR